METASAEAGAGGAGSELRERPRIRPLEAIPITRGKRFRIFDPRGISDRTMEVSPDVLFAILHFDGTRTREQVVELYRLRFGRTLAAGEVKEIIAALEECLFLEGPAFQAHVQRLVERFRAAGVRRATHAGSAYEADGRDLDGKFREMFRENGGEPPAPDTSRPPLRGLVAPHIDIRRGKETYVSAYRALSASSPPPDLFVILGTAHAGGGEAYTATTLDFETPLGPARVDKEFLGALESRYGTERLYADELTHATEHSIELQVVFLRWLYREEEKFRIVPILCGSFAPLYESGTSPAKEGNTRKFVAALRETLAAAEGQGRHVCLLASADLAHIGERFGHADPVTPRLQGKMERADLEMLDFARKLDPEGFFRFIDKEDDRRNICGAAAIYTMLAAGGASSCELLHYGQSVESDEDGPNAVVTFAAMALR